MSAPATGERVAVDRGEVKRALNAMALGHWTIFDIEAVKEAARQWLAQWPASEAEVFAAYDETLAGVRWEGYMGYMEAWRDCERHHGIAPPGTISDDDEQPCTYCGEGWYECGANMDDHGERCCRKCSHTDELPNTPDATDERSRE